MDAHQIAREAMAAAALAIVAAVVVQLLVSLFKGGRARTEDGWTVLRPSLLLYALGAISLAGVVLFLASDVAEIANPTVAGALGIPLELGFAISTGLFAWAAIAAFGVRLRFNSEGVERRLLGEGAFVAWSDIIEVKSTTLRGPVLATRSGRSIAVSEYLAGFRDLLVAAAAQGVRLDRALARKFRVADASLAPSS